MSPHLLAARRDRTRPRRALRRNSLAASLVIGVVATGVTAPAAYAADPVACTATGGVWQIDATCVDPNYTTVSITSESDDSAGHRIAGTIGSTAFTMVLPAAAEWDGRFFQKTYPTQGADASDDLIAFNTDSGAATVQAAGGGGYRAEAALAKYARERMADYYGTDRHVYAYLYGGSGGSFATIGAAENTHGVWDGFEPFIMGTPTAIPNTFFARAYGRFVLEDKAQGIADALLPGGSGDPYAGLDDLEADVLTELTHLGVPLSGWVDPAYLLGSETSDALLGFGSTVRAIDRTYVSDFWNAPGYLGTEASALGDYFRAGRVLADATVGDVQKDDAGAVTSLTLVNAPSIAKPWIPTDYTVTGADGTSAPLVGAFDASTGTFTLSGDNTAAAALLVAGSTVRIDNSASLALMAYHRYQTPSAADFHAWDQYRNPDGTPKYPVRALRIGELLARTLSGGAAYSGAVTAKTIVVGNLVDVDSYTWHSQWYADRARAALGAAYDDTFRVWFFESSDHPDGPLPSDVTRTPRVVNTAGHLEQALRDLVAWVEDGIAPAPSTAYTVSDDAQIHVSGDAATRGGIQQSTALSVAGQDRTDVEDGQPVTFTLDAQVPPGLGEIVETSFDWDGTGQFAVTPFGDPAATVSVQQTHVYTTPGTYIVGAQTAAERDGVLDPFTQIRNLDRTRVIVHQGSAPVVTATGTWKPRQVTLSATDDYSGVARIEYRVIARPGATPTAWRTYTKPISVSGTQAVVEYRATDNSGKTSAVGSFAIATVQPVATTVKARTNGVLVRAGSTVTYTATVTAANGAAPTGTLTVRDKGRVIATAPVTADAGGVVTIQIPKLGRGLHLLTAEFTGDGFVSSTSLPAIVYAY